MSPFKPTPAGPQPAATDDAPEIRAHIRDFIAPRMAGTAFADGDDIFARGVVNSLFALELVLFVEKTVGTRVPNEELTMDHFRSVDALTALASRVRARNAGSGS